MKAKLFFPLMFLLLFNYCSDEETFTVEVVDGVKHVYNLTSVWGESAKVELEFVREIGELDSENEELMFYRPSDFRFDEEGNLYVLDSGNYKLKKFDSNFNIIFSVGNQGQGPGEFGFPSMFEFDDSGNIIIVDRRKMHIFDADGKFIEDRSQFSQFLQISLLLEDNQVVTKYPTYNNHQAVGSDKYMYSLYNKDANKVFDFGEKPIQSDDIQKSFNVNESNISHSPDNYFYIAFKGRNKVEKYDSNGKLILRFERTLNYPVVDEDKRTWKGQEYISATTINRVIRFDTKGRVWVLTNKKQFEEGDQRKDYLEFHIFTNEGVLLGKIPHPEIPGEYQMNFKIYGDRLYIIDRIETHIIYEYRIGEL